MATTTGRTFRDAEGREWTVVIDGYVLWRARAEGGVDFGSLLRPADVPDIAAMLALCYFGCEHNARMRAGKMTREDFLRALCGESLNAAIAATTAALVECLAPPTTTEAQGGASMANPPPLA